MCKQKHHNFSVASRRPFFQTMQGQGLGGVVKKSERASRPAIVDNNCQKCVQAHTCNLLRHPVCRANDVQELGGVDKFER